MSSTDAGLLLRSKKSGRAQRAVPTDHSASTPESDDAAGDGGHVADVHREHPCDDAIGPATATNQGSRNAPRREAIAITRTAKAAIVAARDARFGLSNLCNSVHDHSNRQPFPNAAHHVEYTPARSAGRPRSRCRRPVRADGTIRGPIVGARIRCPRGRPLPLAVRHQPLPRQQARLVCLNRNTHIGAAQRFSRRTNTPSAPVKGDQRSAAYSNQ